MHARQSLPPSILRVMEAQAGVVSRQQLLKAGLSHSVISRVSREWRAIVPGIYCSIPASWNAAVWARSLRGGPPSVLSGAASGHLDGYIRDAPRTLSIWTPERRSGFVIDRFEVRFRKGARTGRGQPTRTRVETSLLDMAGESDEIPTVAALTAALAQSKTIPSRVLAEMKLRRRIRHSRILTNLCDHSMSGIESALEWLFHERVLKPHGLPIPARQPQTQEGRVDNLYREYNTIIELDGMRDLTQWSKDMFRDNAHAVHLGLLTLRYGGDAVI